MNVLQFFTKQNLLIFCLLLFLSSTAFSQESPNLTDPEVASVAVVANQIDISYAEIAIKKSKNKDILTFANTMVKDHNSVINQAVALVTKLSVTPKDNAVSKSLLDGAEKMKRKLNNTTAEAFDRAYINNEVSYHKAVIAAVKDLLIPETENSDLKELLEKVLPILETHLGHAEMIQSKITGHKKHIIEIKNMKFIPAELSVKKGDTVVWINKDFVTHDVARSKDKSWQSTPLKEGQSWSKEITESENYNCTFHPFMNGKIILMGN
jgi:putative membrane protein